MRHFIEILFLLTIVIFLSFRKQDDSEKSFEKLKQARLKVLVNNIVGKQYQYDFVGKKDCNKTTIKYLGIVTLDSNKKFKLLNSFFVVGQSCRGVSRIVIYDLNNKYYGNYYVSMPDNLPDTLVNNSLIYLKDNKDCKVKKGTEISFEKGLPKEIFIPCDNLDSGELFTFSIEE